MKQVFFTIIGATLIIVVVYALVHEGILNTSPIETWADATIEKVKTFWNEITTPTTTSTTTT